MVLQLDEDEGLFPKHRGKELDVRETPVQTAFADAAFGEGDVTIPGGEEWGDVYKEIFSCGFSLPKTKTIIFIIDFGAGIDDTIDDQAGNGMRVQMKIDGAEEDTRDWQEYMDDSAGGNVLWGGEPGCEIGGQWIYTKELAAGNHSIIISGRGANFFQFGPYYMKGSIIAIIPN